jgi:hypothetical protein
MRWRRNRGVLPGTTGWFGCSFQEFARHGATIASALTIEADNPELVASLIDELTSIAPDIAPESSRVVWFDQSDWVRIEEQGVVPTDVVLECVCGRPFFVGISRYPWSLSVGHLRLWESGRRRRYREMARHEFEDRTPRVAGVAQTVAELCKRAIFQQGSV